MIHDRTVRVMPVVIPNQAAPHIAIGVILNGVHWHCDVGYGGRGLRLPIRNNLVQTNLNKQLTTGQLCMHYTFWECGFAPSCTRSDARPVEHLQNALSGVCKAGHTMPCLLQPEICVACVTITRDANTDSVFTCSGQL